MGLAGLSQDPQPGGREVGAVGGALSKVCVLSDPHIAACCYYSEDVNMCEWERTFVKTGGPDASPAKSSDTGLRI